MLETDCLELSKKTKTIVSYGHKGLDPAIMGYGPFHATKAAMENAN